MMLQLGIQLSPVARHTIGKYFPGQIAVNDSDEEKSASETDAGTESTPVVSDVGDGEELNSTLPYPIVGIGASAGGLEAFTDLLRTTPVDTGMSFVIVSHLPPQHRSLLPEILGRNTKMPVHEVEDGTRPEPDQVYVIPANARLILRQGALQLEKRPPTDRIPRPIDIFFRSLAEEQKARAIGIVLSGTDSDGALGLRAIKGDL
jgi:two-component system CheB/CheR fusion protein